MGSPSLDSTAKSAFNIKYSDAVLPFRILMLGYVITGTFRGPVINILTSLKKVKIILIIGLICAPSSIILNIILIKYYEMIGAAIATVVVSLIFSLIANTYLYKYLKFQSKK